MYLVYLRSSESICPGELGIFGWGCAAGTLEPLTYTSSAEFCYPTLELTPHIHPILA